MKYPLDIKEIAPKIILLSMPTQKEISELFIRFQEYYESPFDSIRNKIFTLGQLRKIYAENPERSGKSGAFSYHAGALWKGDWNGFNIPSYVLEPSERKLTEEEFNAIPDNAPLKALKIFQNKWELEDV